MRRRLKEGTTASQHLQLMKACRLPRISDWHHLEAILTQIGASSLTPEAINPQTPTVLTYVNTLHALNYMPCMSDVMIAESHHYLITRSGICYTGMMKHWTSYKLKANFVGFADSPKSWQTPAAAGVAGVMLLDVLTALVDKAAYEDIMGLPEHQGFPEAVFRFMSRVIRNSLGEEVEETEEEESEPSV